MLWELLRETPKWIWDVCGSFTIWKKNDKYGLKPVVDYGLGQG